MQPFETLSKRGQVGRLKPLALNALIAFDIQPSQLLPLQHGDNTTFRIHAVDGERYVLRIHRPTQRTPAEIRSEMMWLAALSREGLEVPEPVMALNGDLLTIAGAEGVPEPRTCVLFRWLEGRFLNDSLTPSQLERVGAFMALIHNSGSGFDAPKGFVRGRLDNLCGKPRGISEALARAQNDNPEDEAKAIGTVSEVCSSEDGANVKKLIGKIRKAQLELGRGPQTFGLIHGDLHQENYLFHQGRVRTIDFDDCGYGHYLYDLAVTLFNIEGHQNFAALKEGFLKGYRSVRPLFSAHEAYLEVFFHLRELQMMLWVIELRNHPEFRQSWEADVKANCKYIEGVVG